MPGKSISPADYRYGFNGAEKEPEFTNNYGDIYDLGERHYDTRIARMFKVDPRTVEYSWQSPYVYHRNTPIRLTDFLGEGDYYSSEGKYVGNDGEKDEKVYLINDAFYDENKEYSAEDLLNLKTPLLKGGPSRAPISVDKVVKLDIKKTEFSYIAGVVSKEDASSFQGAAATTQATFNAVKLVKGKNTSMSDQSSYAKSLLGTDYSSVPDKKSLEDSDASDIANNARAGLIHVLMGGKDYSNGAVAWDGIDFAIKGSTHPKGRDGGFSVSETLWNEFTATYNWTMNKGKGIKYKGVYYSSAAAMAFTNGKYDKKGTSKWTKGRLAYKASVVYGQHLFWAPNYGAGENKGYNMKGLVNFDF